MNTVVTIVPDIPGSDHVLWRDRIYILNTNQVYIFDAETTELVDSYVVPDAERKRLRRYADKVVCIGCTSNNTCWVQVDKDKCVKDLQWDYNVSGPALRWRGDRWILFGQGTTVQALSLTTLEVTTYETNTKWPRATLCANRLVNTTLAKQVFSFGSMTMSIVHGQAKATNITGTDKFLSIGDNEQIPLPKDWTMEDVLSHQGERYLWYTIQRPYSMIMFSEETPPRTEHGLAHVVPRSLIQSYFDTSVLQFVTPLVSLVLDYIGSEVIPLWDTSSWRLSDTWIHGMDIRSTPRVINGYLWFICTHPLNGSVQSMCKAKVSTGTQVQITTLDYRNGQSFLGITPSGRIVLVK